MKLYSIRRWNDLFENNRSRTVKALAWVAIPNKHDGEHFTAIMQHPDGAAIFSAWVLMLQVASKTTPRGTLQRGDGTPHTDRSLSAKCRCPASWFTSALAYLEQNTDWLDVKDVAAGCQRPDSVLTASCHPTDEEGKGIEGKGIEKEGSESPPTPPTPSLFPAMRAAIGYVPPRVQDDDPETESVGEDSGPGRNGGSEKEIDPIRARAEAMERGPSKIVSVHDLSTPPFLLKKELNRIFKRKRDERWSHAEECVLVDVASRPDWREELALLEKSRANRGKYFPQSILKLLDGWNPALDAARNPEVNKKPYTGPNI